MDEVEPERGREYVIKHDFIEHIGLNGLSEGIKCRLCKVKSNHDLLAEALTKLANARVWRN